MFSELKRKMYKSSLREKLYCLGLKARLKNKNFTIICNNCWAGSVYEDLGLPYNTPTVGLFFYAPCYIKFLKNLEYYLKTPLMFKNISFYSLANERRKKKKYPIGVLDDIEIHFLHYASNEEALEKWNRRKQRVNLKNLYVAFSDVDLCTVNEMQEFDIMHFPHKVFFSAKNYEGINSLVWLKSYVQNEHVGDLVHNPWSYRKYFDVVRWLNQ